MFINSLVPGLVLDCFIDGWRGFVSIHTCNSTLIKVKRFNLLHEKCSTLNLWVFQALKKKKIQRSDSGWFSANARYQRVSVQTNRERRSRRRGCHGNWSYLFDGSWMSGTGIKTSPEARRRLKIAARELQTCQLRRGIMSISGRGRGVKLKSSKQ